MVSVDKKWKGSALIRFWRIVTNWNVQVSSATQRKLNSIGLVVVILYFALGMRVSYINTHRDFWHDEAFQYLYSQKDLDFIIDSNDVHPPLFNIFTHYILKFQTTPDTLRLYMAFLSLIWLVIFYIAVKDSFGIVASRYALLTIAFIPAYTYYSTEFRNYTFTLIFVMLSVFAYQRMLKWNTHHYYGFIWAVSSALAFSSHYLAGLITFTQLIYLAYLKRLWEKRFWLLVTAGLCTPTFIYAIRMLPKIQSFWFKDIDLLSLISTFSYIVTPPTNILIGFGTLVYGVTIFGLIKFRKDLDKRHLLWAMYLVIPIITMWIISQFIPFYHHRYFLFGAVGLYAILGWTVHKIANKWNTYDQAYLGMFIVLVFLGSNFFMQSFNYEISDSVQWLHNHDNTSEFATIHSSTFSQSTYKVRFPNQTHYLWTNLTRQMLFTAGGEVINYDTEYYNNFDDIPKNQTTYWVSNKVIVGEKTIYSKGGLFIQELNLRRESDKN